MSHLLLSRAHLSLQLQLFFATRLSLSLCDYLTFLSLPVFEDVTGS